MTAPPTPKPSETLTDRELVARYVRLRDEIAFATLVRRHSSLVLGVCHRVLRHRQDVEDAFQATFLVLARDAHRVRKRASLASWLHGVAYRTSLRAAESRHRRDRLLKDVIMSHDNGNTLDDVAARHERQLLDEELQQLPDKYRAPLVLHYLESRTARQVADELKLSISTVEGRLKRGRKELQLRLARRGVGLSVALAAVSLTPQLVTAAELNALVGGTIHAGLSYSAGDPAGPLFTHQAARLAAQETFTMTTTTATVTLTTALLVPVVLSVANHGTTDTSAHSPPSAVSTTLFEVTGPEPVQLAQVSQPVATHFEEATTNDNDRQQPPEYLKLQYLSHLPSDDQPAKSVVPSVHGRDAVIIRTKESLLQADSILLDIVAGKRPVPSKWHFKEQSPSVQRIEAALESPAQLELVDTPLSDAMDFIARTHEITILFDKVALDDAGVTGDTPVNLIIANVRLDSALNLLLRPLRLDYILRDETLTITSTEVAANTLETRVYNLRQVPQMAGYKIDRILQDAIPGAKWKPTGEGTVQMIEGGMVVTQTQRVHRQIIELLEQLRRHAESGRSAE